MRLLHLDIETAPNLSYTWGLFKQTISLSQLVEPGYTLCWAAKWHGQKDIQYASVHHDGAETMVEEAYDLLDQADVVVHYNGKKFDVPTLQREFVLRGYSPPKPFVQVDLIQTVRQKFRFASNKLDFVAQQLGLGAKSKHAGMELWRDCMAGCPKAWATMKRYNRQDVVLTEKLYNHLLPWISNHPNQGHFVEGDQLVCPNCSSTHLQSRGVRRTKTRTYRQYKCQGCGSWPSESKCIKPTRALLT